MKCTLMRSVMFTAVLALAGCEDSRNHRGHSDRPGASVDVNTTRPADGEDPEVKVRVRTPGGDYNVDVNY